MTLERSKDSRMSWLGMVALLMVAIIMLPWSAQDLHAQAAEPRQSPSAAETKNVPASSYLPCITSQFEHLLATGTDGYGPRTTKRWMAVIDTRTGKHPESVHTPRRVYREIGAPRGSSLYWDQAMILAAHRLTEITGDQKYRRAADDYIQDFLATSVDANGMFQWGNHCYYDAIKDRVRPFSGGYHELRPHTPAWGLFWEHDAELCRQYIRTMVERHLHDPATGGFNRHDDGRREHAFLEAGGVLVESLAWLHTKTRDDALVEQALKIAQYSYRHRGQATGLIVNNPDGARWDALVCTTEVGLWANCLLRAAQYTSHDEFTEMARDGVEAYLRYGYDDKNESYFGQLAVKDGQPVVPAARGYWPREYSDIWNPDQWPTHDYPLELAEACIVLHEKTGDRTFQRAVERWSKIVEGSTRSDRKAAYAGQYGKCIRFLILAAEALDSPALIPRAQMLADEAVERLYENGWFQGYSGAHVYESVDGVGDLILALMDLEMGTEIR